MLSNTDFAYLSDVKKNLEIAYLSLGSNLGNRAFTLQQALFKISKKAGSISNISSVYSSKSWGFEGADFLNLCLAIETTEQPQELLEILLGIEKELGRDRGATEGYTSRTLDIDILYYGTHILSDTHLEIPHPKLTDRAFVLKPLSDIAPQFYHPVLDKDSRNLLQACGDRDSVQKTNLKLFATRTDFFTDLGFLAIEGNIGSGKTTLANLISEEMNAKLILERFAENPFLPKFYEDRSRYAFPLEMSFLADRYQQYIDDTSQLDLFKNFMVSDYDIYKSLIFAKITLQEDEYKLYRRLFGLMYSEVRKPKLYVYLYQRTEKLLEQIAKRGRSYEQGIPADYLESIHRGYFDFMKNSPDLPALIIDMEGRDFVANPEDYQWILDQMCAYVLAELRGIS
jgi:2-amino-4-hydroxy-6-hydroxymethyldihydropteridine diphosphokinase